MAGRRARETWWRRVGMPLLTHAVLIAGCVVMLGGTGGGFTVSVAVALVAEPAPLTTRTLNCAPLSAAAAVGFSE